MGLQTNAHFFFIIILTLPEDVVSQNATHAPLYPSLVPPGCGGNVGAEFWAVCDMRLAWGVVVQVLAMLGFLSSLVLLLAVLLRWWFVCGPCGWREVRGWECAGTVMFLLAVGGIFALPYSFIVGLTERTCPVRILLFGGLLGLAFACLLARALVLGGVGCGACRGLSGGWVEPGLALVLSLVQAIIAVEWLVVVLVRDGQPCSYSQEEFVLLLVYVMVLLAVAMALSLRVLCCGNTYRLQGTLMSLTLLLSAAIWVVWIALLTRGNREMGRQPAWDDPVISIALTANGWVLLLGHGLNRVRLVFQRGTKIKTRDFTCWTSRSDQRPEIHLHKQGAENQGFNHESKEKGGNGMGVEPVLRSPYESSFSMTEIDPDKDYSIPRPQTTNISEPYDDYYEHRLCLS